MSPARARHPRASALTLALALALVAALAACNGPSGGTPAPTSPGGSGAAACATAPSPPDDLEGWGPPASAPEVVPYIIASAGQLVCGPNRLLFTLIDAQTRPVGAPDRPVKVAFYNLGRDAKTPIASLDGTFVWAIEDERGIYVANVDFPEAGRYGAAFSFDAGAGPRELRLTFDVQLSSAVVKVGDRAPASKTPTLTDVGGDIAQISTDANPDPAFYETSVDEALAAHEPFVLIFATPRFCTSAQCGPTLDRIKPYVDRYPTVTFINVEPYKLTFAGGSLQADLDASGRLQTAPVTDEWHLFNEPAVYVVDREGVVRASFELIFSDAELTTALDAVK